MLVNAGYMYRWLGTLFLTNYRIVYRDYQSLATSGARDYASAVSSDPSAAATTEFSTDLPLGSIEKVDKTGKMNNIIVLFCKDYRWVARACACFVYRDTLLLCWCACLCVSRYYCVGVHVCASRYYCVGVYFLCFIARTICECS